MELDWHRRHDSEIPKKGELTKKELKIQALVDAVNCRNMTTEHSAGMQEPFGSTIHLQTEDVDMDEEVPEDGFYMDY